MTPDEARSFSTSRRYEQPYNPANRLIDEMSEDKFIYTTSDLQKLSQEKKQDKSLPENRIMDINVINPGLDIAITNAVIHKNNPLSRWTLDLTLFNNLGKDVDRIRIAVRVLNNEEEPIGISFANGRFVVLHFSGIIETRTEKTSPVDLSFQVSSFVKEFLLEIAIQEFHIVGEGTQRISDEDLDWIMLKTDLIEGE